MRFLTGLSALLLTGLATLAAPPTPLATFSLREDFGVAHPDQIVLFDAPPGLDASRAVLTDDQGKAVPFQVMRDGRVAVRTDLPAGAVKTWRLVADPAPAPAAAGISITELPDCLEITNGLVGLRVPKAPADLAPTPAPIQGLRFQDGTWTAVGPNAMARPAKNMTVDVLDRGPLVARVKIRYIYDKKALHSNLGTPDYPDVPAGEGPYAVTLELQAGQPSILFEEECETDIAYSIDITKGLNPDKARYRGHHAESPAQGMETNGAAYASSGPFKGHDALMDLPYDGSRTDRWSRTSCPFMSHWDPWAVNTGYYWQLYDSRTGGSDNLLGIFAGPASRLIRPGLSGVSIDTRTTNGLPQARLQVSFQRFMPTQQYTTRMRFGWGLFLGKTSTDLKPPYEVQAINRQMNLHGSVNLTALQALPTDYPDAVYGSLYVGTGVWMRLAEQLQAEARTNGHAIYKQMMATDHTFKDVLDLWTTPDTNAAAKASGSIRDHARSCLETLVNGEGIYKHETHYFMGASGFSQRLIRLDQLLGSSLLGPEEKQKLKQCAALIGFMLWDHDLAPMQAEAGVNWGPQNMSSMWLGTRYNYTVFLSAHPLFADRARQVGPLALEQFHAFVEDCGACTACAHYTGASMTPILNMLQQLQMNRLLDAFAAEPLLKRYAEWEMQLMTPPEVRFGGLRKNIAVGDSSTEFSLRTAQLGTGFATSDPALSARLMGSWQAMGSPHSAFYGSSQLKVDPSLPASSPDLGSDQFQGWMSVLRHGWGTTNESAAWFINGETLVDHRHNDNGALVVYALGTPLSLDWGSMYSPRSDGGLMHSIAVPEDGLKQPWDSNNVPLDWPHYISPWTDTEHRPLASFSNSAAASARFRWPGRKDLHWQRSVWSLHPDPAHPVLVVDDVFTHAPGTNVVMISTFNMMAQGEVKTPGGAVLPEERFYSSTVKTNQQLPSAGVPFALAAGLNRFQFTGQWLIDWDLYVRTEAPAQAAIGNWAHNWHPSGEAFQFAKSQGRPFSERQHVLRLRGQDRFRTLILPYRKGEGQSPWRVETQGPELLLQGPESRLLVGASHYACQSVTCTGLTSFGPDPADAFDIRIEGGPAEVLLGGTRGTAVLSGAPGDRLIRLPAGWTLSSRRQASKKDGQWLVPYEGGAPKTLVLVHD